MMVSCYTKRREPTMKRKETRTLHGILTLMLMLGLMMIPGLLPQNVHAATEYDLCVGGTLISTMNEDDVFGDGKVSFVPANGDIPATLILNNFTYGSFTNSILGVHDGVIAYWGEDTLVLEIKGRNVLQGNGVSHGIVFNGTLIIRGDGSLSVAGYNTINNLIIYSTKDAHGIYGDSKTADLLIESGTIEASGGGSVDGSKKYNGIKARCVTINGGTLTATGRTYGIDGDVTVSKDMSEVKITGTSGAIGKDSILKNDVSGKGWANEGGTGDGEKIAINTEGMSYSYKKILFNAPPVIVDMPTASAITYGQTLADSTLTGGTVKDGEVEVPGNFAWMDESIKPNASDSDKTEYEVTFTPTDTANYDTMTTKVKLTVNKADLTIKAKDQTLTYNGQTQGGGDTVYKDAEEIADKVTVEGLQGGDKLTSITISSQGKEVGEYDIDITEFRINDDDAAKDNYDYTLISGKLTITPAPQPPATSINNAPVVLDPALLTYTGQPVTPVIQTIGGKELQEGKDFTVTYAPADADSLWDNPDFVPVDAGNYVMTITGKGKFAGSTSIEFTIGKAAGTLTATGNKVKAKSKTVKLKKAKKFSAEKAYTIEGAIGELTYTKVKANKASKKFKVNAKSGQVKVKKGLKKGKYKLTVLISDSGDKNHEAAETQAIVKIKVKK